MRRISVVGCSGAGKSTVARRIAAALDLPYVELDALHWGPGWTAASAEELRARVLDATAGEGWVVDGNYHSKIGSLVWDRADTVVWLDPPRWRVMVQSLSRTIRRVATREELWNGNREDLGGLAIWRGRDSILGWAWTSHARVRERCTAAMRSAEHAHLAWHRLRTRADARRLLASLREVS